SSSAAVGHQIRFDSNLSEKTRILFVTEGILLRRLESDPEVSEFDVIIVDEVHERHLVVDFVLGILNEVARHRRPDLKLVLMSATLQKDLFIRYFDLPPEAVV
ncbi:Dhx34, partial [Symbiodinium necroappetens]